MKLTLQRAKDGNYIYRIPWWSRIIYGLFALLLLFGLLTSAREGGLKTTSIVPLLLLVVGLAGLTYRESWLFDSAERCVTSIFGFAWFVRREVLPYDQLEAVEVSHFVRGRPEGDERAKPARRLKSMVIFSLLLRDGSKRDIEIVSERSSSGRTESIARLLAGEMALAYRADRPYDDVDQVSWDEL
jgi:hypothetical protein